MLSQLGQKYGTDRVDQHHGYRGRSYCDVYERYFQATETVRGVIEIGVLNGAGLLMWRDYFPNAWITGIDIDPRALQHARYAMSVITGSQDDPRVLDDAVKACSNRVDIVIDDGAHINELMLASFRYLWPKLEPGGWYVFEDMGCSYLDLEAEGARNWPGQGRNTASLRNDRSVIDKWLLDAIKDMDHQRGDVWSIHCHPRQILVEKCRA